MGGRNIADNIFLPSIFLPSSLFAFRVIRAIRGFNARRYNLTSAEAQTKPEPNATINTNWPLRIRPCLRA